MYELHQNEQYFFDEETLERFSSHLLTQGRVCCLGAPLLGKRIMEKGGDVAILDIDDRFADLPGFRHFDIYRPKWIGESFNLIFCDPPFFSVSLSQLFAAIRLLSRNDFRQPLMLCYLVRRASAVLGTFAPFSLKASGIHPGYQTVRKIAKNDIELFSNRPVDFSDGP